MKLSLVVLTPGKTEGKTLAIPLAQFVIGRDPQCHLRPASPSISKRHCAVIQREGKAFVRDFDSTNGTFVNDVQIKGEAEIHDGDQLKVGPLLFSVKIEASTAVNRPTPAPPTKAPARPAAQPPAKPAPAAAPAAAAPRKPAPKPAEDEVSGDEDSVAAMLLSLQDDSGAPSELGGPVPEGSTVMDLSVPPPDGETGEKKPENKKEEPKGSSSNAAKALLEKYMRRPR